MGPPAPKGGAIRMTKLCEIDGPHDVFRQSFFPLRESSSKKSAGSQTSNRPDAIQVANQDGNTLNDRLPGYVRNAFTGPDYATIDLRLTHTIRFRERYKLNLMAEAFNLLNRDNQRVTITSNGMVANASTFVQDSVKVNLAPYPGYYQLPNNFMKPNAAYAPRQIQLATKFVF
jgi:hypothetical protein